MHTKVSRHPLQIWTCDEEGVEPVDKLINAGGTHCRCIGMNLSANAYQCLNGCAIKKKRT
jgi:hypothetical protein